jgi:PAS domain S-box-containing protein
MPENPAAPAAAAAALFEAAPAALLHLGADGRLQLANAAARTLCGEAATAGAALAVLWHQPAEAEGLLQPQPAQRTLALAGATVWVEARSQPLPEGGWVLALQACGAPLGGTAAEAQSALDLAVDLGNIAVWRHDLASNRMHYNAQAYRVLDIPPRPEGLTLDEVRQFVHPDDLPGVLASAQHAMRHPGPTDMDARYRRADGSWRQVMTRRVLQRDAQGRPQAFIGVALDVTQQHEEQRRAAEMQRRFNQATEAAGIGYWVVERGGTRATWNASMRELFALAPGETPPDLPEWLRRFVHPDDQAAVLQRFDTWRRSGRQSLDLQMRTVRPDGSVRHISTHSRIERRQRLPVMFGVVIDLTERRSAEQALRTAEQSVALAAHGAGLGTWQLDLDSNQAYWDDRMWQLRGLPPQPRAMSEAERLACVHPDEREQVQRQLSQAIRRGQPFEHEFRIVWPDGQVRWLASRSVEVRDADTGARRRIGVNWDVTDKRNAEAAQLARETALAESRAKSRFLARMSHELRTPLNAVLGFAQLLLAEERGSDAPAQARRRRLEHIRAAGQHLLALINDVLDLSSLESGELRIALQPVALAPLVEQTLPMLGTLREARQVQLQLGELPGVVMADATRLRQALLNLLTNAIKYNRVGGTVHIDSLVRGEQVALRVRDSGRGMTPEQMRHLFEPFNRLGRRSEGPEGTEGSGIGLAIVKALVEGMGGSVQADSTAGEGSVFELRLVQACAEARAGALGEAGVPAPALAAAAEPGPAAVPRRATLLYVEDNPVNALIIGELLQRRPDLQLHVAADGASGVQRAMALRPDLVLLDMQLPDMDGLEVMRRLRAEPALAQVPVIALSANAMPEDIEQALRAGMSDYWTKPLDFAAFLAAMDTLFGPAPGSV